MGTNQAFRCGDCSHEFTWVKGEGDLTQVRHCRTCGIGYALPHIDAGDGSAPDGGPGTEAPESASGPSLPPVPGPRTHCHCGGELAADAPVRCGRCLSTDVRAQGPAQGWR